MARPLPQMMSENPEPAFENPVKHNFEDQEENDSSPPNNVLIEMFNEVSDHEIDDLEKITLVHRTESGLWASPSNGSEAVGETKADALEAIAGELRQCEQ